MLEPDLGPRPSTSPKSKRPCADDRSGPRCVRLAEADRADAGDLGVGDEQVLAVGRQAARLGEARPSRAVPSTMFSVPDAGPDADRRRPRGRSSRSGAGRPSRSPAVCVPGSEDHVPGAVQAGRLARPEPLASGAAPAGPLPATVVTVFAFRSTARMAWFSVSAT